MKIGIVVSEYNFDITSMMLERAIEEARFLGVDIFRTRSPGHLTYHLALKSSFNTRKWTG